MLGYIIALLVVGGLLFLGASMLLGRGETQPPAELDRSPVELPDDRLADGDDLRALRLSVAVRGYRMDEVDWLLDRISEQVDTRDREIARLRSVLHVEAVQGAGEPELLTHPFPAVVDAAPEAEPDQGGYAGHHRPRPVPEELGRDTGARPDRPARHLHTTDGQEPE